MKDTTERIYRLQPLWGCWKVDGLIGSGTFGKVYRVSHKDFGQTYVSAVKIISIPDIRDSIADKASADPEETVNYRLKEMVQTLINEVAILYTLSGNTNILGYHDHLIIEHEDGLGWDVLIRMENAKSLSRYLSESRMNLREIITLGLDICTALDICSKRGIIHRDIKDENIFINEEGVFKLGDFGIAMDLVHGG